MPKVTEFRRRVFASSAVGTPGVDTSAGVTAGALSRSAQSVSRQVASLQGTISQASRVRSQAVGAAGQSSARNFANVADFANRQVSIARSKIAAQQAKVKTLTDNTAVSKNTVEAFFLLQDLNDSVQEGFSNGVSDGVPDFLTQGEQLITDFAAGIQDETQKQKFLAKMHPVLKSQGVNLSEDLEAIVIDRAGVDYGEGVKKIQARAAGIRNAEDFANGVDFLEKYILSNNALFDGKKLPEEVTRQMKAFSKNVIDSVADRSPEEAQFMLHEQKIFDQFLTPTEKKNISRDLVAQQDAFLKSEVTKGLLTTANGQALIAKGVANETVTPNFLEQHIQILMDEPVKNAKTIEYYRTAKKVALKRKGMNHGTDLATSGALGLKFDAWERDGKFTEDDSLKLYMDLQRDVLDAFDQGAISKADRDRYNRILSPSIARESTREDIGGLTFDFRRGFGASNDDSLFQDRFDTPVDAERSVLYNLYTSGDIPEESRLPKVGAATREYYRRVFNMQDALGRELNAVEAKQVQEDTRVFIKNKFHPETAGVKEGDILMTPVGLRVVESTDENGIVHYRETPDDKRRLNK